MEEILAVCVERLVANYTSHDRARFGSRLALGLKPAALMVSSTSSPAPGQAGFLLKPLPNVSPFAGNSIGAAS